MTRLISGVKAASWKENFEKADLAEFVPTSASHRVCLEHDIAIVPHHLLLPSGLCT